MHILEVKNNLVKIIFSPEHDRLFLAGFVTIENANQLFIGQVVELETKEDESYALIRLIFTFSSQGVISAYNGEIPDVNSRLQVIRVTDLLRLMKPKHPIQLGEIRAEKHTYTVEADIL